MLAACTRPAVGDADWTLHLIGTVHRGLSAGGWCLAAELHVPAGQGRGALPQARRHAPRPKATKSAGGHRQHVPQDRGPGPGPQLQHPHPQLHP